MTSASGQHIHSGGTSTCAELAVCSDCGLSYGLFSETHGEMKIKGASPVVWLTDGYSGDICCKDCGQIVKEGRELKADPNRSSVSFIVRRGNNTVTLKTYSVGELDALKTTNTPIGYSYGSKSPEIVATTEYVTLDSILNSLGVTENEVSEMSSVVVECTDSTSTIPKDTIDNCNKYYEDGHEYSAPAAFMIAWNTGQGTLEQVAEEAKPNGNIRFGYGISQEEYENNTDVGGKRLVSPVETVTINIGDVETATTIKNAEITIADADYSGNEITPEPVVQHNGVVLQKDVDYDLLYSNNTVVGTAKVVVIGKGNYTGSKSEFFKINPLSMEEAQFTLSDDIFTGSPITQSPDIAVRGKKLTEGIDYTISYTNNINVGTASVTISGIDNYTGSVSGTFAINQKPMIKASVTAPVMKYTGKELTPQPVVTLDGKLLKEGRDYSAVTYSNNVNEGTAGISVTGKGNYTGTATGTFEIVKQSMAVAVASVVPNAVYTGATIRPKVVVKYNGAVLSEGKDYTLSYAGNTAVGTASITVSGQGLFGGYTHTTFRIIPKKAVLAKLNVKKGKKIVVKMKTAVSRTGGTKYAVQYRVKGTKKWKTKYTNKQSITLTKLKAKKKYQIQVRAYKGGFVGAWSGIKTSAKIK